jgi:transcriptional regulator with XRE-family HTH domain
MAVSQQRTKVAQLRATIGVTGEEFARMTGKTVHTVSSWESGRLKLSEKAAARISEETSASMTWLLHDERSGPPVDSLGDVITKESFEAHRAAVTPLGKKMGSTRISLVDTFADLLTLISSDPERFAIAAYRASKFLAQLENDLLGSLRLSGPERMKYIEKLEKKLVPSKTGPKKPAGSKELAPQATPGKPRPRPKKP